jgi:membrane protein
MRGIVKRYRQRYPALDRLVRAGQSYTAHHGDHYAAAITFFSVLSLVPLLMIVFAAVGFVLAGNPDLLRQLQDQIQAAAPEGLAGTLKGVIDGAIASRHGVGVVGLLGALYSGLGWMGNLRDALTAQWDQQGKPPESESFLRTKVFDLLALLGLGLALVVSFALTGAGTGFARVLLDVLGLANIPGAQLTLTGLAVAASVAGMWLVFLWVIARLPRKPVPLRRAMRAAWFGAVGFEFLKQGFAIYLDSVTSSPTGAVFGPVIGLMVFAYFVSRFLLFLTAWAAAADAVVADSTVADAPVADSTVVEQESPAVPPQRRSSAAKTRSGAVRSHPEA